QLPARRRRRAESSGTALGLGCRPALPALSWNGTTSPQGSPARAVRSCQYICQLDGRPIHSVIGLDRLDDGRVQAVGQLVGGCDADAGETGSGEAVTVFGEGQ